MADLNRVLVTGVAGFIGYSVAERLLARGVTVVGIDNLNDYYDVSLKRSRLAELRDQGDSFQFIEADIGEADTVSNLVSAGEFSAVIHLAAQAGVRYSIEQPMDYVQSNVAGFLNLLEALKHLPGVEIVYASSSSVYGKNRKLPFSTDDRVDTPVSMYAATKRTNELMAQVYHHQYGLSLTGLRFFTVYGPWGRPDMSPFLFADALFSGEKIKLFNYGEHSRDFTYVSDIVDGILAIVDAGDGSSKCSLYNIGRGEPVSLRDYVETLESLSGVKADIELLPMQPGDVERTWADITPMQRDFGYRPRVSLEQGLEQFFEWFRRYYAARYNF